MAFGETKAPAIAAAAEGPVSASVPGSVVQLHPKVTIIVDEAAASALTNADYYRHAWDNRFDWERF
jgi:glucosamine-6-phosphate deaminase